MTTEVAQREAQELTELLSRQRDVYNQLRQLASAQSTSIQDDEPEQLLRILGERQRRISELVEINTELEPFRSRWNEIRDVLDDAQRQRVGDLVGEVESLLADILAQDDGDCDLLQSRQNETRRGMASASLGRKVNAAYAAQRYGAVGGRYVDRDDQMGAPR